MNNLFRGLIAGIGAWKLGGGCVGTIVVFIIIWLVLGQCSWFSPRKYPVHMPWRILALEQVLLPGKQNQARSRSLNSNLAWQNKPNLMRAHSISYIV